MPGGIRQFLHAWVFFPAGENIIFERRRFRTRDILRDVLSEGYSKIGSLAQLGRPLRTNMEVIGGHVVVIIVEQLLFRRATE